MKTNELEVFEPILKEYCLSTKNIDIDPRFSNIFLPCTMSNYASADKKIFYIGRDTKGNDTTEYLMKCFDEGDLADYIQNDEWINEYGFLDYNNNHAGGFWTLAMKLHLRIKGVTDEISIGPKILRQHKEMLNDFGWGNTNSIELKKTLQERKYNEEDTQSVWENIDQDKYWLIKEKSLIFDKLIHTIQAYSPDIVFVFNWDKDEEDYLEGLTYTQKSLNFVNDHFMIIDIVGPKTKLIWTVHPRNLSFQGYNIEDLIVEILTVI